MNTNSFKILKVRFDKTTLEEASNKAIIWAKGKTKKQICTPNPEIILEAQKNPKYLKILNNSDLNVPDGIGIIWANKFLRNKSKLKSFKVLKWFISLAAIPFSKNKEFPRVTGVDLMQAICKKSSKEKLKIFLLGAGNGVAEKVKDKLEKKCKGIKITGTYSGSPAESEEKEIIKKIDKSNAEILFVAFGAPKQEIWIAKNIKKLKSVKVAMGVGGSFDFITGIRKRAQKWLQKTGLEWLYRVIQQPSRFKRIYNATIKFPIKILKNSLK